MRLRRLPAGSRPALELLGLLLAADAVVVLLHVVNELGRFYAEIFNLDEEENLPTWLATAQFLAVATAAGLLARLRTGRIRLAALALALVFAYFSLDEVALVHEKLAEHSSGALGDLPKLPILYSPIALACVAAGARARRRATQWQEPEPESVNEPPASGTNRQA